MNPEIVATKDSFEKSRMNGNIVYHLKRDMGEGTSLVMDVTNVLRPAVNKDRRHGYEVEDGPNFGIEIQRAVEYFEYVFGCRPEPHEAMRFNTTYGYLFSIQRE